MDENEFFRNATLRICGNLEIEKALHSCLLYMQKVMPLDIMFLKENMIVQRVDNTDPRDAKVQWNCKDCDTVIEVNGGFCKKNEVELGDRVVYSAVSETDIYEVDQENVSAMTAFADLI